MGDPSEPWRGRRDARWMVMWPLTSLVSATCAFALVWVAVGYGASRSEDGLTVSLPTLAARSVAFFLVYALSGAVLGLLVALVLTFLVGDAHGRRAEQAARLVGGGTYAVAGLAAAIVALRRPARCASGNSPRALADTRLARRLQLYSRGQAPNHFGRRRRVNLPFETVPREETT